MTNIALNAFNPSEFEFVECENIKDEKELLEFRKNKQIEIFNEVVEGLINDLESLGFEITFASKIIVHSIAQNIVLLQRFKLETAYDSIMMPETKLILDRTTTTKNDYYGKLRHEKYYDNMAYGEKINVAFDKYLPRLQKQIIEGLKCLGLHPTQLIERQKLIIVKKLRQKYENITGEISIETSKEKKMFGNTDENRKGDVISDVHPNTLRINERIK